jgi:8-oxo-dGTP pyrophosphatase MutT (NUDIX family)
VVSRGGPQEIPRPPSARPGRPAPWAGASSDLLTPSLADVKAALADASPARPVEQRLDDTRAAAVLAALYDEERQEERAAVAPLAHVVLTRRAQHLRSHRGEVSFPGGAQEPGEDFWTTAVREAFEEVALDPTLPTPIGELDHLRTVTSQSFIVPLVAELPSRPVLVAHPGEVEQILHVSLAELLLPEVFHEEIWTIGGQQRPIFFFDIVGDTIWGATAAMLRNLLAIVTGTFDPGDRPTPWGPFTGE